MWRGRQSDWLGAAMSRRALARDAALRQPLRASHHLAQAWAVAERRESAHERAVTHWCAADIAWRQRRPDAARAGLDEACAAFQRLAMPWHLDQARRLQAALATDPDETAVAPVPV